MALDRVISEEQFSLYCASLAAKSWGHRAEFIRQRPHRRGPGSCRAGALQALPALTAPSLPRTLLGEGTATERGRACTRALGRGRVWTHGGQRPRLRGPRAALEGCLAPRREPDTPSRKRTL